MGKVEGLQSSQVEKDGAAKQSHGQHEPACQCAVLLHDDQRKPARACRAPADSAC